MKRLTLALVIAIFVALSGNAVAGNQATRLFTVVNPTDALFTEGGGHKQIALKLHSDRVKRLDVKLSVANPVAGRTSIKPFQRFSEPVNERDDAKLSFSLPHLGLFKAQVTARDSDGDSLGRQAFRIAALGTQPQHPIPSMGVSTHFSRKSSELPGTMDLIRRAGFGRIRDEMPWSIVEPELGRFKFPSYYDRYVSDATQRDIQPLITLDFANTKAYRHLLVHGSNFLATGEPMDLFQDYVRAIVNRYGDQIHTWELWNEPNFSKKGVRKRYAELLKKTHKTLSEIAPGAELIACGGAGVGGGPNGECFLDMIKSGTGKAMDGYSIHPYMGTGNPPGEGYAAHKSVIPRVSVPVVWRYNARLIRKHRAKTKRDVSLWVTEIGWYTSPVKQDNPELMQAAYLDQLYLLTRKHNQAKSVFWYNFRDVGSNPKDKEDKEDNFGLITHDYQPKPGYVAAATLTRALGDRPWVRSLKAVHAEPRQQIEQYGEGDNTVVAAWTNSRPGDVMLPVANGRYVIRRWDGQQTIARARNKRITLSLGQLPVFVYRAGN